MTINSKKFLWVGTFASLCVLGACQKKEPSVQKPAIAVKEINTPVKFTAYMPEERTRNLTEDGLYFHTSLMVIDESHCSITDQACMQNMCVADATAGYIGCWGSESDFLCMFDCIELRPMELASANN